METQTIQSQRITRNFKQCLSLYYWLYRPNDSINVSKFNVNRTESWKLQNINKNSGWQRKIIPIEDTGDYWLLIQATGNHLDSRFAVDDIVITNTECQHIKGKLMDKIQDIFLLCDFYIIQQ